MNLPSLFVGQRFVYSNGKDTRKVFALFFFFSRRKGLRLCCGWGGKGKLTVLTTTLYGYQTHSSQWPCHLVKR